MIKTCLRYGLSLLLVTTGTLHFVHAGTFVRIMPPGVPFPLLLVYFTGVCEWAAAVGLQVPDRVDGGRTRRLAAWLLMVFFVAVFPANVYMAMHPAAALGPGPVLGMSPETLALLRLPLQVPLILWAWWYTRR